MEKVTNVIFVSAKVLAFCSSAQTVMLVSIGLLEEGNWEHELELEGAELLVDNLPDDFVGGHCLVDLSVDVG